MAFPDSTLRYEYAGYSAGSPLASCASPGAMVPGQRYRRQPCRVLARGQGRGPYNRLVEFADGHRMVVVRKSLRRWAYGEVNQMEMF